VRSIHLLAGRHRLPLLIASGVLLLAGAVPAAARHPGADERSSGATFSSTLDSAADEMDGWAAGALEASTGATTVGGTKAEETGSGNPGTTDSTGGASHSTNLGVNNAGDASDVASPSGTFFAHAGTADHGRPHRADPSDQLPGGQGITPNG
jgi:hypothetical protein